MSLWTGTDYSNAAGIAYLGYLNQSLDGQLAFNVCSVHSNNGSSYYLTTFAHECGHNLGCGHARDQDENPGPSESFPIYGAGWRWTDGTIMR